MEACPRLADEVVLSARSRFPMTFDFRVGSKVNFQPGLGNIRNFPSQIGTENCFSGYARLAIYAAPGICYDLSQEDSNNG